MVVNLRVKLEMPDGSERVVIAAQTEGETKQTVGESIAELQGATLVSVTDTERSITAYEVHDPYVPGMITPDSTLPPPISTP